MSGFHEAFTPAVRVGLKGREVGGWLAGYGLPVPSEPNGHAQLADGRRCLRLGVGEYLLAHDDDPAAFDSLLSSPRPARVHPLLRSDRCLRLHGPDATARLLQLCDFDERRLSARPQSLALLMVADVSVVLHTDGHDDAGLRWRLWIDPTFVEHVEQRFARTYPLSRGSHDA